MRASMSFRSKAIKSTSSLFQLKCKKEEKKKSSTISKLRLLQLDYHPKKYQSINLKAFQGVLNQQDALNSSVYDPKLVFHDVNFAAKCKALCDEFNFNLAIFKRTFELSRRKKTILQKLYGWDEFFSELLFQQHVRQELKDCLSSEYLFETLNFQRETSKNRNLFNKIRLFLSELEIFLKKQQQLETQIQRRRLDEGLNKLQMRFSEIKLKGNKMLAQYASQMSGVHSQLREKKQRIHNRKEFIDQMQSKTGKLKINDFYLKEQKNADTIEKFIKA